MVAMSAGDRVVTAMMIIIAQYVDVNAKAFWLS